MRVIFEYTPTSEGYKMRTSCEDIPTLPDSLAYDNRKYCECFEAIKNSVDQIVSEQKQILDKYRK